MKKINIEEYKKEKEKFDSKILEIDYKIVELSVKIYNAKHNNEPIEREIEISKNQNEINRYEFEKKKLTSEIWQKVYDLKITAKDIVNNKLQKNPHDENAIITMFLINKLTDVYFDVNVLERILNFTSQFSEEGGQLNTGNQNFNNEQYVGENEAQKNIEKDLLNRVKKNTLPGVFDIKEERVLDFKNILDIISKLSENYRNDIKSSLERFFYNYEIVKNAEYLKSDFDNITNNYMEIYRSNINKFKKVENVNDIENRIEESNNSYLNTINEINNNTAKVKNMENKIKQLQEIYFVNNYATKILKNVIEIQENNNTDLKNEVSLEETYEKIKKIVYNKRLEHILEVSNWTKSIEELLKEHSLEEEDFQFVIYLVRQTESICNNNFEKIANLIIQLIDKNIKLENAEVEQRRKIKILEEVSKLNEILSQGIENIKKKYSKIPFIGRKIGNVLNSKLLTN